MSTLALHIVAPLQAWGASEEGEVRRINPFPTRSGIMGMIANAAGNDRGDSPGPWETLSVGVRTDLPGTLVEDFHTSFSAAKNKTSLTRRMYLSDASFLVVLEGSDDAVMVTREALSAPKRPIHFGRKGCPPSLPVVGEVYDDSMDHVLRTHAWIPFVASVTDRQKRWNQYRSSETTLTLDIHVESVVPKPGAIMLRDVPVSRTIGDRRFNARYLIRDRVSIPNPFRADDTPSKEDHDPFTDIDNAAGEPRR